MATNPILDEIYRVREEYAREFGFDLQALGNDLRKKQREFGGPVVSLPPKRFFTTPANIPVSNTPATAATPT